jgi:hypothetical protein
MRRLRAKHRSLYSRSRTLARGSGLPARDRLVYRLYWGLRPIPARIEQFLYSLHWAH